MPFWVFGSVGYGLLSFADRFLMDGYLYCSPSTSPFMTGMVGSDLFGVFITNIEQLAGSSAMFSIVGAWFARLDLTLPTRVRIELAACAGLGVLTTWLYIMSQVFNIGDRTFTSALQLHAFILGLVRLSLPTDPLASGLHIGVFVWDAVGLIVCTTFLATAGLEVGRIGMAEILDRVSSKPRRS
jgi:hypothetical protein